MTRKDYVAVSNILQEYATAMEVEDFVDLVNDFARYMQKDNDRFQKERFLEACGVPLGIYS